MLQHITDLQVNIYALGLEVSKNLMRWLPNIAGLSVKMGLSLLDVGVNGLVDLDVCEKFAGTDEFTDAELARNVFVSPSNGNIATMVALLVTRYTMCTISRVCDTAHLVSPNCIYRVERKR